MADNRHHDHRPGPVQTSAVYLLGRPAGPVERPPSPPSPAALGFCPRIDEDLPQLDIVSTPRDASLPPVAAAAAPLQQRLGSPAVTAPPSPSLQPADCGLGAAATASTTATTCNGRGAGRAASPPALPLVEDRLAGAVRVLTAEAEALVSLARLYGTDPDARAAFDRAVSVITQSQRPHPPPPAPPPPFSPPHGLRGGGGTLVVSGVGKSGHIARKLTATFSSLSVRAAFMHPTEALHGDLGLLSPGRDAVVLVSFSGRTPELLALAPHLHPSLPVVIITAAKDRECEIAALLRRTRRRRSGLGPRYGGEDDGEDGRCGRGVFGGADAPVVVLPAPIPVSEVECLGIAAPTASTTAALALGDALAVVAGRELHGGTAGMAAAFTRNHPGGAIGAAFGR